MMNAPLKFVDLPEPPANLQGWPWTPDSKWRPLEPEPTENHWPKISIVTVNYNYGHFLEETIRSVLLQGYPNLEYILIDGGSTDNSLDIIRKYEKYFTYWVSEPDGGQTDALNKGYQKCTGDIYGWLNSDDTYTPATLWQVAKFRKAGYEMIAGSCRNLFLHQKVESVTESRPYHFAQYLRFWAYPFSEFFLPQPSVFLAKQISDRCFPLDPKLHCAMDHQYFLRALSQSPKTTTVKEVWSEFKSHGENKTGGNYSAFNELCQISLAESIKLPFFSRELFKFDLNNFITIHSLLELQPEPKLMDLVNLIRNSPSVLKLLFFWKVFAKSLLGSSFYSFLKEVRLKSERISIKVQSSD
jgi:glycosyltransferase involved in cell wall biosynthesis